MLVFCKMYYALSFLHGICIKVSNQKTVNPLEMARRPTSRIDGPLGCGHSILPIQEQVQDGSLKTLVSINLSSLYSCAGLFKVMARKLT